MVISERTDSDKGIGSEYDKNIEMRSGDEHEAENQSALESINDEKSGQQDGEELGEEMGKRDGQKGETGGEEDSDEDEVYGWWSFGSESEDDI